jgi:F0F1-type ATP synthase assembly protein I
MEKFSPAIRLIGASFYIGLCIFLGVFGGVKLDEKLQTQPIFTLIGLVLGLILAFWGFYQMVMPLIKDNSKQGQKRDRR